MVGAFQQIFRGISNNRSTSDRAYPMLNSLNSSLSPYLFAHGQIQKKKALMYWFKSIPELTGLVSKVVKDIVHDFKFVPANPSENGRNRILRSNEFALKNELRTLLQAQVTDAIVTGEGFGWMAKIEQTDFLKVVNKRLQKEIFLREHERKQIADSLLKEFKEIDDVSNTYGFDEDILAPRKFRYVASSTMEVIHDEYDIKSYKQVVGTNEKDFTPKEILRVLFSEVDGKVGGFTPVESILVQLELLRQMWQNNLSLHKNGGHPDKIISLENERMGTPSFKRIEEQLLKYRNVENKHGHWLFTGKVNVQDLQQINDMQFLNLGLYITGVIALQWEIPRSSIPYITSGANTKDDTGGNSEKGYWRNVKFMQQLLADTYNTQLFIPYFGTKIVFENTFLQQDIQAETAKMNKLNNLVTMNELLSKSKLKLSKDKLLRAMDLSEEDTEEMEEEELNPIKAAIGMGTPAQLSDDDVNNTVEKNNIKKRKQTEQENISDNRGSKPNGVTKESDYNRNNWYYEKVVN